MFFHQTDNSVFFQFFLWLFSSLIAELWAKHEDVANILWIQARSTDVLKDVPYHHPAVDLSSEDESHSQRDDAGASSNCEEEEDDQTKEVVGVGNKFNLLASPD